MKKQTGDPVKKNFEREFCYYPQSNPILGLTLDALDRKLSQKSKQSSIAQIQAQAEATVMACRSRSPSFSRGTFSPPPSTSLSNLYQFRILHSATDQ